MPKSSSPAFIHEIIESQMTDFTIHSKCNIQMNSPTSFQYSLQKQRNEVDSYPEETYINLCGFLKHLSLYPR